MRRSSVISAALLLLSLLVVGVPSGAAAGDKGKKEDKKSVTFEPGLWQVTTTVAFSALEKPRNDTSMKCLQESPFAPWDMAGNRKSCEIDKTFKGENEMSWTMTCKSPPLGNLVTAGFVKSTGAAANGRFTTTMKLGDQDVETKTTWVGTRLGECEMERPKTPVRVNAQTGERKSPVPAPAPTTQPKAK